MQQNGQIVATRNSNHSNPVGFYFAATRLVLGTKSTQHTPTTKTTPVFGQQAETT